jgi:hypothetical protein
MTLNAGLKLLETSTLRSDDVDFIASFRKKPDLRKATGEIPTYSAHVFATSPLRCEVTRHALFKTDNRYSDKNL